MPNPQNPAERPDRQRADRQVTPEEMPGHENRATEHHGDNPASVHHAAAANSLRAAAEAHDKAAKAHSAEEAAPLAQEAARHISEASTHIAEAHSNPQPGGAVGGGDGPRSYEQPTGPEPHAR
jgi:hypothetical protein